MLSTAMPPEAVALWLEMRESFEKGAWRVLPVYPHGHVLVQGHLPATAIAPVCALIVVAAGLRRLVRRLGIAAGRAVVAADLAPTVDWDRFGDIAYFTCCHLLLTAFFVGCLGHEAAGWLATWQQLWDFWQPALSPALWWYYVVQLALTTESCLHMLHGLASNGGRDLPMLIHHAATIVAMMTAFRFGYARVGASVLFLHDASDLPIDATRVCRALGWLRGLYFSVVATLTSWAALRLYAFPRYLVAGALFDTNMNRTFDYVGTRGLALMYGMYAVPLMALTALHYYWFAYLLGKAIQQLGLRRKAD